jgi:hypothetical protein
MNKKQIQEISKVFDCYLNQYDSQKYPLEIYKEAKKSFSCKKI